MKSNRNFSILELFSNIFMAITLAAFLLPGVNAQGLINKQQIIVRFNPEVIGSDADRLELRETFLREWREKLDIDLGFVRDFGTDGFVIATKQQVKAEKMETIIERMNEDPRVRYAEADAVMTISPPPGGFSVKPQSE